MHAVEELQRLFPDSNNKALIEGIFELPPSLSSTVPYKPDEFFRILKVTEEEKK